jgi:hypothetical protein
MSWMDDNEGEKKEYPLIPVGPVALKLFDCELDETGVVPKITLKYKVKDAGQKWVFLDFTDSRKKFIQWQMGVLGAQSLVKKTLKDTATLEEYTRGLLNALGELLGNHYMGECEHYTSPKTGKTYDNIVVKEIISANEFNAFNLVQPNTGTQTPEMAPPKVDTNEQLPWES